MNGRRVRLLLFAPALALVLASPARGQTGNEASIEGTISDSSGAAIADASIAARNLETDAVFQAATDQRGMFRFLVLPAGRYAIDAEHPGFARFVQQPIVLTVGAKVSVRIVLPVRQVEEVVTVSGEPPPVEPTRTSFSSTIDDRSVASLPINGRNYLNFALLTPAIADTGGGLNSAFYNVGGQISMNSLLIDGADHNSFLNQPVGSALTNRYLFSQDAIQEIQVNTGCYSAEFGRAGTAVINVITKSGTNQLHGSGFWYYRDDALSATAYNTKLSGDTKAPLHMNQFGGAAGGRIVADRLFFFASYDGQRREVSNSVWLKLTSFRPNDDPEVARYQQRALAYLDERADSYTRGIDQNVTLAKLDWRISGTHWLSAQWNRHRLEAPNLVVVGHQQAQEHNGTDAQVADTLTGSATSQLSSTAVNVARASYVSTHTPQTGNSYLPEAVVREGGETVLQVGRLPRISDSGVRHLELADTLSLNRGRHAPKLGGSVLIERSRFYSSLNFFGAYLFNSLESFGRSLEGAPRPESGETFTQAFAGGGKPPIDVHPDYVQLAAFVQDAWRIRPTLTLDLGLRYDVQLMATSPVQNPSAALLAAGVDTSFVPTDGDNLAPRVGFAWTPASSDRTVLRGGYGLYFPRLAPGTAVRPFFQNGITTQTRSFTRPNIPAYPDTMCGAPDPSGTPPDCTAPAAGKDLIMAISRDYEQPVTRQGSLGVEYALGRNLSVAVTYLRINGDHLMHLQDVNLGDPITKTIGVQASDEVLSYRYYPSPRPMTDFNRVFLLETNGRSTYNGLVVQVNKRFSHGFQFAGSYTFGSVVDDNPTDGALNPGTSAADAVLLSDSRDPGFDRGAGSYGQHHRFVLSGIWRLDYAAGLPQPARAIFSDWEISGIVAVSSGFPYSALVGSDLNNDGNTFTDRTPGVGRNTYTMPASVVVDVRFTRTFSFKRARVLASCDVFNLLNRVNINDVNTKQYLVSKSTAECGSAGTPCLVPQRSFGTPSSGLDPRTAQVSLRVTF